MKYTEEQTNIVNCIKNNNIIVDSVVGSGKTSTIIYIAEENTDKNILSLTYNKRLKLETRNKTNLSNIEIHSFHSFCYNYFSKECYDDSGIQKYLKNEYKELIKNKWSIIIIDEAQDINPLYYTLICLICSANNTAKICLIGDKFQSIYGYNRANPEYMTDKLYKFNDYEWSYCTLTETFRLTNHITTFINNLLGYSRIKTNKISTNKIRYLICNQFSSDIFNEIQYYIGKNYKYDDIFIIAPSLRNSSSSVKNLANKLSSKNIPIYYPMSDNESLDNDITDNKIVFCTFHQSKGLERKVSIVFNFDESYHTFYNKNYNGILCNELYVAISRSSEELTVIHHYANNFLPFVDINQVKDNFIVKKKLNIKQKSFSSNNINCSVSDLIRHIPIDIINECMKQISIRQINSKEEYIKIKSKIRIDFNDSYLYENVSDINGLAIPAYYEKLNSGKCSIQEIGEKNDNILYLSNKWLSKNNGINYKFKQIKEYNWIPQSIYNKCSERFSKYISKDAEYEVICSKAFDNFVITGFIDCLDQNTIWEFKCTENVSNIHFIQLAIYSFFEKGSLKLFYVLTNELYEIDVLDVEIILKILINYKFNTKNMSDNFIKDNLEIMNMFMYNMK